MNLDRCVVVWSGFPGGPGVSIHYAIPGGGVATSLRAFYFGIRTMLPINVTVDVPEGGDTIDDATGDLVGTWTTTSQSPVTGSGTGAYAAPAGGLVRWNTGSIVAGRRLRGRTFIVPMVNSAFDAAGQLTTVAQTTLQGPANTLVTAAAGFLTIWSRPTASRAGSNGVVTSAAVGTKASVLTSRRD